MDIHPLYLRDEGNIICGLGDLNITFSVTVRPLPILTISPLSHALEEGQKVSMVCNISNAAEINMTEWKFNWYLENSKKMTETSHTVSGSLLSISSVKTSDNGDYQCRLCRTSPYKCLNQTSSIHVYSKAATIDVCHEEKDNQGIIWEETPASYTLKKTCPAPNIGIATRRCEADGNWGITNMIKCVRKELEEATEKLEDIKGRSEEEKKEVIKVVLDSIKNVATAEGTSSKSISSGNLKKTTTVLNTMINLSSSNTSKILVDENVQENFVGIIDDMLSEKNEDAWTQVNDEDSGNSITSSPSGAGSLLATVEKFGAAVAKNIDTGKPINLVKSNIVIKIERTEKPKIAFKPNNTSSGIELNLTSNSFGNVTFTAAFYKTMGTLLQNKNSSDGVHHFTSEVLSLSLLGANTSNLTTPVILTFNTDTLARNNNLTDNTRKKCVFWNETQGWLSQGCSWVNSSCQCTHLTNFAVLISPIEVTDSYVLRIISFVGCILSVLSTVTTMVVYLKLWRFLKSDRNRLLLNLCAALTIAYVLFLAGIDKTQDNTLCTVIAALLHYFFLSTFCLMLAEGIQLLISVTFVYQAVSKLRWLLLLGWGVPLVVVGVTVGIQYNNKYHSKDYCWLTLSNGVLYSFVGPAVGIILVNIIVIFCVMKALFSSQFIATKTEKQKIVTGIRSLTVLLPVLGVTWIFGVISVNDDLIVFQYLFAVTNSLQGFFIFLFYCIFNVPVRRALEKKIKRFEYRTQSSKTGSKLQVMKTKSTDSGNTKDEDRPQKEFDNPVFRFPRPSMDHNIGEPQYNVEGRYNYRSCTYMLR
ncbi:brain-specific angiogenesis inhibitor 1-like [Mizuhopecten yessoensis]|uniref:brain-specific angiogenesis inhibitor 1-like n=1 Tax=Mizuhopecten yessoensis TaxID=6573 RepID=UPI000B45A043|nr:brain-specific angiogenesis inhibitor 1-like [Mizuhopecten yessoensis]